MIAKSILFGALLIILSMHAAPTVHAAPASGITMSPFQQQITMLSTQSQQQYTVRYTNNTATLQELRITARDFGSLNDTGGVLFGVQSAYTQRYGLASWLRFDTDTLLLAPGESKSILVTVDNRSSLQPGGHYAAVVATVSGLEKPYGNAVSVNQQLLSLLFLTKTGGERYDLKLDQLSHNGNWLHLPRKVKIRFQNPGNVHVIPRGLVQLKSPNGTVLAQGVINSESALVLPESYREMYVELKSTQRAFPFPGMYQLAVQYRYEGLDGFATKTYRLSFINAGMYMVFIIFALCGGWFLRQRWRARKAAN